MHRLTSLTLLALAPLALTSCGGEAQTGGMAEDLPATTPEPGPALEVTDLEPGPVTPPTLAQAALFASATNGFAVDLWGELRAENGGNLILSPASIQLALAMAYGGAGGSSARQMEEVMGAGPGFHEAAGAVLSTWNDPDRETYQLAVANRLFGRADYKWRQPFLDLTAGAYGAPFVPTDFLNAPEPARVAMNKWVEKKTKGRIADLIPPGGVHKATALVLINAIYFKADWTMPFEKELTWDRVFHGTKASREVPTMHQTERFRHGKIGEVQLLELPYAGGDLSMLIALPRERDGLPALEQRLSAEVISAWGDVMTPTQVEVALPRFKIAPDKPMRLGGPLTALGMEDPFARGAADFTPMADGIPQGDLFIDSVFHKAFVEVDEKGTEAAAATAVTMRVESEVFTERAERFTADHPFLFFIRDRAGTILFMGRVADLG